MQPLVITTSKQKYIRHLVTAIAFVVIDVLIILHASRNFDRWIGWCGLALFGSGVVIFLRELLDSRPRIIIDDLGINDRKLRVGLIPWSEITGAYIRSVAGSKFICLSLRQPGMFKRKELNLILSGTNADPIKLLDSILIRVH